MKGLWGYLKSANMVSVIVLITPLIISALLISCGRRQPAPEASAISYQNQQADFSPGTRKVVTAYRLNLRQGPSTRSKIVAVLRKDDLLTVRSKRGGWLNVLSAGGELRPDNMEEKSWVRLL